MPVSSFTDARDTILSTFTTAWNAITPTVPPLLYEDSKQEVPDTQVSWARIQVRHNVFTQETIGGRLSTGGGGRRFRRFGLVTVQIFTKAGDGLRTSDSLAKVALDAFEGVDAGADTIEFRNVRLNEIGRDGEWFQVNVLAEFEYDEIK